MARRVLNVATATLIAVAATATVLVVAGTVTGSWHIVPVRSGSMAPLAPKGSAVVAEPSRTAKLHVGDVVLFRAPTAQRPLLVHRINEVVVRDGERLYRTKGDANSTPDPWLIRMRSTTVWRVHHVIPKLGSAVDAVSQPTVRIATLVLATLALLGLGLARVWRRADADESVDAGPVELARVAAVAATVATSAAVSIGRSVAEADASEEDGTAVHSA